MGKVNNINNRLQDLTIDPGASGDSLLTFFTDIGYYFKVDDDDSDKLVIKYNQLYMTIAGEITTPQQPCFLAHRNADLSNVTGDDSGYRMTFDSTEFDQNNDFDDVDDFTAPVDGIYYFCMSCLLGDLTTSHTGGYIAFRTSSADYRELRINPGAEQTSGQLIMNTSVIAPMSSGDTAYFSIYIQNSTKTVDIVGNTTAGAAVNYFAGYLIG